MKHFWISQDMPSLRLPYWITETHRRVTMNLQVLRWLMSHSEVLFKVLEIAKKWDQNAPLVARWAIVDEIARIVLPVLEEEATNLWPLAYDHADYDEDDAVEAFSLGVEAGAMGIDWKAVTEIILPIVAALLKALAQMK